MLHLDAGWCYQAQQSIWAVDRLVAVEKFLLDDRPHRGGLRLLRNSRDMADSALPCGFIDPNHFQCYFKAINTARPQQYRVNFTRSPAGTNLHPPIDDRKDSDGMGRPSGTGGP